MHDIFDLSNNDLQNILYTADLIGSSYPFNTFQAFGKKEINEFGEYHKQRLVLET